MKANRKFTRDEDAVSPVIGVILMVAITVILAAVIAAFVFGMGSSLSKQYVVAATVSQISSDKIDITYAGGPDHDALSYLNITVTPGGTNVTKIYGNMGVSGDTTNTSANPEVGETVTINGVSNQFTERDHVVIAAEFFDGSRQVILDTYL